MRQTAWVMTGTLAAVLVLAGCQGEDQPQPSGAPTPTSTSTATSTGTAPTTQEPTTQTPTEGETETPSEGATSTETSTAGEPTGEATETDAPSSMPPWTRDQVEQAPAQAESGQEITGVRTGRHDGYDRVVLDLTGDQPQLGWFARLVDEALEDPSGLPLDVEGERFVQLGIAGIDWTTDSPERYDGQPVQGQGTEVVTEVVFGALFEGQQQVLIGLREDTDYRVFSLSDPARIVIDVRQP